MISLCLFQPQDLISIQWIVSSSLACKWVELVEILKLDAIDWELLLKLITKFLSILHSLSREYVFWLCCARVVMIREFWAAHWCSFSWTFVVIGKMEAPVAMNGLFMLREGSSKVLSLPVTYGKQTELPRFLKKGIKPEW